MRKLFSLVFFSLSIVTAQAQSVEHETSRVAVINPPATALVFEGKDSDIPIDKGYLFAISGANKDYSNYEDTIHDVANGMPHWMRRAIRLSRNDVECVVMVNDVDYFAIAIEFFMQKKRLLNKSETWYATFNHARDYAEAKAKLQEDVCRYVKQ